MKDLPHHMKKLNRRVIRSENKILDLETREVEDIGKDLQTPLFQRPKDEQRKQSKAKMRKKTLSHIPEHPSLEERNQMMKHRVPIFDRTSHPRPKEGARPPKKSPRIDLH